jgi:hypothetical protein
VGGGLGVGGGLRFGLLDFDMGAINGHWGIRQMLSPVGWGVLGGSAAAAAAADFVGVGMMARGRGGGGRGLGIVIRGVGEFLWRGDPGY